MEKHFAIVDYINKKIGCHCGESMSWADSMMHYCPHCNDYYFICSHCQDVNAVPEIVFNEIEDYAWSFTATA